MDSVNLATNIMQTEPDVHDQRVVVGVSGGVDSALTLQLLRTAGYQVTAAFMINWHADANDRACTLPQDLQDAQRVCDALGVELHTVDFSQEYRQQVFNYCLDQFALGHTPNPDVLCNSKIKFQLFYQYIQQQLQANWVATGHYARKVWSPQLAEWQLLKGVDANKDQSYFLHRLTQSQLANALFPLGAITKPQARAMAKACNLPVWNKPDSTGVCFIGERHFRAFLQEYLLTRPGPIQDYHSGQVVGEHCGVWFYTIGQRAGLRIGGIAGHSEAPWYVLAKDVAKNLLIVTQQETDLLRDHLYAIQPHWINAPPRLPWVGSAKIRYRQADQECTVELVESRHPVSECLQHKINDTVQRQPAQSNDAATNHKDDNSAQILRVTFAQPQRAITPGQAIAFYHEDWCLGGAVISA